MNGQRGRHRDGAVRGAHRARAEVHVLFAFVEERLVEATQREAELGRHGAVAAPHEALVLLPHEHASWPAQRETAVRPRTDRPGVLELEVDPSHSHALRRLPKTSKQVAANRDVVVEEHRRVVPRVPQADIAREREPVAGVVRVERAQVEAQRPRGHPCGGEDRRVPVVVDEEGFHRYAAGFLPAQTLDQAADRAHAVEGAETTDMPGG